VPESACGHFLGARLMVSISTPAGEQFREAAAQRGLLLTSRTALALSSITVRASRLGIFGALRFLFLVNTSPPGTAAEPWKGRTGYHQSGNGSLGPAGAEGG
jgi:hypothetical protein